ncbi:MAG: hypothetical protein ABSB40_00935 [Nitrososphaeria archaeon]|jgi:hypothetical protein
MVEQETWEDKCCRCEGDVQINLFPGKRACHVACGSCLYPEDWGKCLSCEIVGHCMYALEYLKNVKLNGIKKGCFFDQQLQGDETIYQTLNFVNGQQSLIGKTSEQSYLEGLKKANAKSPCLQK